MYVHNVVGIGRYTTSTTNMYNKTDVHVHGVTQMARGKTDQIVDRTAFHGARKRLNFISQQVYK